MNKSESFNKSLLILKSHAHNLLGAETFLRKRDWRVFSTTSLKEALNYLIQQKPGFIMISTEFPHRKISELMELLPKLFPVCTIAFTESNTVTSYQYISEMGADYQMYPPATGPAFERIVNKYLYDRAHSPADGDALLVKGLQIALEESVISSRTTPTVNPLQKAKQVACLAVECPRFCGYVVAAMATDQPVEDKWIQTVREKLFSFLKSRGEVLREEDVMNLSIREVPFLDMAEAQAEFLKKSVHHSDEVALAFFPRERLKASFDESYQEDMIAVKMEEIQTEKYLDFDLYLYLPANKKALLYTPRGSMLYAKQKTKLISGGIQHLHLAKADLPEFNKYRAEKFLNDKITEFEEKQRRKNAIL